MENNQNNLKRTKYFVVCGLLILCVINACWMLSEQTLDSHECFVSVAAREMLQSGDWVVPTLNGEPRLNKTPLSYWLVASFAKITGRVDEFTARFPSAVFAVLTAISILYFVNRWLSFRIAALCTGVWATSLTYIRNSHSARPDMVLTFFTTLCFLSFFSAVNSNERRRQVVYALIFWASFGLANLAKGPAPLPLVIIPLFFFIIISKKWAVLPKLLPVVGSVIFLAIVLPWPLIIANKLNWDLTLWKHEFVDRLFGDYARGNYPFYYYFLMMFKYVTPWIIFLPMALAAPFYKVWKKKQPVMKFLWIWFVLDFAFLTIDLGKRQHYILPLIPAMAILIGILLEDMAFTRRAYNHNFVKRTLQGHIVIILGGTVVGLICVAVWYPQFLAGAIIFSIEAIMMTIVTSVFFATGKPGAACGMCFAGIVGWVMIFMLTFSDFLDIDREARNFAQKTAYIVPQSDKIIAYKDISTRFLQYFGKVVPVIEDISTLHEHYQQGEWIVAISGHLKELDNDKSLRKVYYQQKKEKLKEDTSGALFHITAPIVKYSEITDK
jgi:4-amino-4-deoxy-L-arabinose transferase-like glycosyltransferase